MISISVFAIGVILGNLLIILFEKTFSQQPSQSPEQLAEEVKVVSKEIKPSYKPYGWMNDGL